MPVDVRIQWVMGVFLLSGICFWVSMMFPAKSQPRMAEGWTWLQWRPFPGDLSAWMGVAFMSGLFLQAGFFSLQGEGGGFFSQPGVMILVSVILFQGLLCLTLYYRLHRLHLNVPEVLGLENPFHLHDLVAGLVGYSMSLPLVTLAGIVTIALFDQIGWELSPQPLLESFTELKGWLNWTTIVLVVVFIGPLLEEVIFRGFVFGWMQQKAGARVAVVFQAFLFALIHQHAAGFLPFFALAIVLGLAYVYTQRLMVCVWMHVFFNGMTLLNLMLTLGEKA